MRDLGGARTDDGYRVRPGVLYRSDAPQPGDLRAVAGLGLPEGSVWPPATVIDLRSPAEVRGVHPLADVADVRPVPLGTAPAPDRMTAAPGGRDGRARAYRLLAAGIGPELARIVRIVADAPAPVLVHGAAGKDRTGLVVGVLLAALGVPRAAILADYLRTNGNLTTLWARLRQWGRPGQDALPGVDAAALEPVLEDLAAHDDGVPGLLGDAGITECDLRRLAERLLEPDLPA
nr:tyrosine-protein phosphatase [Pseudonocardia sp. C8]